MIALTWWLLVLILGGLGLVIDCYARSLRPLPFWVAMHHIAETARRLVGETSPPQRPVSIATCLGWPMDSSRWSVCAPPSRFSPLSCRRAAGLLWSAGGPISRAENLPPDQNDCTPRDPAALLNHSGFDSRAPLSDALGGPAHPTGT